jgi:cytochrome c oxidase subunit 4
MIVPTRTYFLTFAALIALTGATVAASRADLGPFNLVVALAIAATKATLVVLIFMHVKYASRLTQLAAAAGFFWLGILLVLTMSDYVTRGWSTAAAP